jgi:hypothetical protein
MSLSMNRHGPFLPGENILARGYDGPGGILKRFYVQVIGRDDRPCFLEG